MLRSYLCPVSGQVKWMGATAFCVKLPPYPMLLSSHTSRKAQITCGKEVSYHIMSYKFGIISYRFQINFNSINPDPML